VDVEDWAWTPAVLQSVNFHALDTKREELGCLKFTHFAENKHSTLKVKISHQQLNNYWCDFNNNILGESSVSGKSDRTKL